MAKSSGNIVFNKKVHPTADCGIQFNVQNEAGLSLSELSLAIDCQVRLVLIKGIKPASTSSSLALMK